MAATLVILAAGMASRYGSMKQIEGFGPAGETIMEYSIYCPSYNVLRIMGGMGGLAYSN